MISEDVMSDAMRCDWMRLNTIGCNWMQLNTIEYDGGEMRCNAMR
jgi:hypothetical protein